MVRWSTLGLVALLAACAGDDALAVRGDVSIAAPDGTATGLDFVQNTRLVDEDFAGADTNVIAGRCRIGRDENGDEVISLSVSRPNAVAEGFQVRSFALQLPRAGGGELIADLGGDTYRGSVGADCIANLEYVQRGDGLVGTNFNCGLRGAEGDARAQGELFFEGCTNEN
ncbi:MAG: hypothetical protein AAGE52_26710 [Myxococcota bacterium]